MRFPPIIYLTYSRSVIEWTLWCIEVLQSCLMVCISRCCTLSLLWLTHGWAGERGLNLTQDGLCRWTSREVSFSISCESQDWLAELTVTDHLLSDDRHCWVCFATEKEDRAAEWVSPCRCKGCTKWIHQSCLQRWLDEKQKGNSGGAVNCPQCGTEYRIVFPKMGEYLHFTLFFCFFLRDTYWYRFPLLLYVLSWILTLLHTYNAPNILDN